MKNFVITVVLFLFLSYLLPGFFISGFWMAVLAALVMGLLNLTIKPIFQLLSFPVNLLTLGLFQFILEGAFLYLVALIVPGFFISGFWWAVLAAVILSVLKSH